MKRYWLSIVLIALIVVSLGSFYSESLLNPLPNFKLVKLEGDEKQAADMVITGTLKFANGNVRIDQEGSTYDSEKSLLWQIADLHRYYDYNTKAQLNRLKKEHGSFMRGKENLTGFYEDKQLLADVELISIYDQRNRNNHYRFHVSLLDKASNKVNEFEISVPLETDYQWMNIQDVQRVGNQLMVLTNNANRKAEPSKIGDSSESHMYSVDFTNKKIVKDYLAGKNKKVNGTSEQKFSFVPDVLPLKSKEIVVFETKIISFKMLSDTSVEMISADNSFSSFNLRTGKEELIPFPINNISQKDIDRFLVSGDRILKLSANKEGMTLEKYNLAERKTEPVIVLHFADFQADSFRDIQFDEKNIYLLVNESRRSRVIIIDLDSGQTVYKGSIALEDSDAEQEAQLNKLNLQNIVLTK